MNILSQICTELDLRSLPSVSFLERRYLPSSSGVYLVMRQREILYIGQSINIRQRWQSHNQSVSMEDSDRIAWWELPGESLNKAELVLIERFNPRLNARKMATLLPPTNKEYYKFSELMERYGLSARQSLYNRVNGLGIETTNNGKRGVFTRKSVELLDELHRTLVDKCSVSKSETKQSVLIIKKNLKLLKEYYEGNSSMSVNKLLIIVQEALNQADQLLSK